MPSVIERSPIRQSTELTLDSTLREVLLEFVTIDQEHLDEAPELINYENSLKVVWSDTSHVRLDLSVMSIGEAIEIIIPPYAEVPSGENPNNPGFEPAEPVQPAEPATLETLTPDTIAAGGEGFDLTIDGTGFVDGSRVYFGVAVGDATLVSPEQVTMHVGPDGYAEAGTVEVSVEAPGGAMSNSVPFTIT
jgi:hypothetical protein